MNNKRKKNKAVKLFEVFLNILILVLIYLVMWFIAYRPYLLVPLYKKGIALLVLIYAAIYAMFSNMYSGYKVGHVRVSEIIYSQFLAMFIANGLAFFQICLIDRRIVKLVPILILTIIDIIIIVIWAFWANKRYQKRNPQKEITIIYGEGIPCDLISKMKVYWYRFKINSAINEKRGLKYIKEKIGQNNGIVLCNVSPEMRKELVKYCFENSIPNYIIPDVSDIIIRGAETVNLLDTPLLLCDNGEISLIEGFLKRCFDLALSIFALILTSPFMLLTAIAIKLQDGGPVLFKQKRLTIGGKIFEVYKFRSMIVNAEKDGVARLAQENDDRITSIGKFIRKVRLDELPQLFNIIKGDMSIVGPRPERPELTKQYKQTMPEFEYRLKVKAGLTGYAQVLGRYNTTPYDKLMLDMMYIEQYSFFLDIQLIFMTVKILFMRESTQGLAKGETTANERDYIILDEKKHLNL